MLFEIPSGIQISVFLHLENSKKSYSRIFSLSNRMRYENDTNLLNLNITFTIQRSKVDESFSYFKTHSVRFFMDQRESLDQV